MRGGQNFLGFQLRLNPAAGGEVLEGVFDGLFHHALDFGVGHVHGRFHLHDLLRAGLQVAGEDVEDAVGINLELHADARDSTRGALEGDGKFAEAPVVGGAFTFALEDVDEHLALVVHGGGEDLAGLDGNGAVARDNGVHQAAEGLDAERERGHVE